MFDRIKYTCTFKRNTTKTFNHTHTKYLNGKIEKKKRNSTCKLFVAVEFVQLKVLGAYIRVFLCYIEQNKITRPKETKVVSDFPFVLMYADCKVFVSAVFVLFCSNFRYSTKCMNERTQNHNGNCVFRLVSNCGTRRKSNSIVNESIQNAINGKPHFCKCSSHKRNNFRLQRDHFQ